jgi:hypothetical protein
VGAVTAVAQPAGASGSLGWTTTASLPAWSDRAPEGSINPLANVQVYCDTKTTCVGLMPADTAAADNPDGNPDGAVYTNNGGKKWTGETIGVVQGAPNSTTPVAMSCSAVSPSFQCMALAVGDNGATNFESNVGGTSWGDADMYQSTTNQQDPDAPDFVTDVSCPAISTCQWVGSYPVYNPPDEDYGGLPGYTFTGAPLGPWTGVDDNSSISDYYSAFQDESCIAAGVCFMTGISCATTCTFANTPTIFSQNGSAWQYSTALPTDPVTSSAFQGIGPITCVPGKGTTAPSKATCYVALTDGGQGAGSGGDGYPPGIAVTRNGGATWSVVSGSDFDGIAFAGFTCVSATVCFAFGANGVPVSGSDPTSGGEIWLTVDGGSTWTYESSPANTRSVDSITCAKQTDCMAGLETSTGYAVAKTTDAGSSSGTPSRPTDVVAKVSGTTATVKWGASFAFGSPITNYTVQVNNLTAGGSTDAPPATTTSSTVTDLIAGDQYNFYIYANNANGSSLPNYSNTITAT